MIRMISGILLCLTISLAAWGGTTTDISPGQWAGYDMLSSREYTPPPLTELRLTIGPSEGDHTWWQMTGIKPDGGRYAVRMLSEHVPMAGLQDSPGAIKRYIHRENDDKPMEYLDARTGAALLPKFEFAEHLLPRPSTYSSTEKGFASTGTCLGHMLSMMNSGLDEWADWPSPDIITLNPDEIHFMRSMVRDEEGAYISDGDYTYVPLTREELDEMIDLGLNSLRVSEQTEEWVYRRPVYYYRNFPENWNLNYPEILYRSNYRGVWEFIDEPEIHILKDRDDLEKIKRPEEGAYLIRKRVEEIWDHSGPDQRRRTRLREQLMARGANVGTMTLADGDYPIWLTMHETSFYQLQGGTAGVVHEGRYSVRKFVDDSVKFLGKGLKISPREMLLVEYAYLRGAARAFDKHWGMSIYGQCDPDIAPDAVTLAYDMGARWIWVWSTDHQHHLPHFMKLKLLKHLQEHKKAHPRGSLDELLYAPRTAVVLPYGYVYFLQFYNMWESRHLHVNFTNSAGVPHRDVFAAALGEAIACARAGEDFDITVDAGQDLRGYTRLIRIGLDGRVSDTAKISHEASTIRLSGLETLPFPGRSKEPSLVIPYRPNIRIDGDLSKWPEDGWMSLAGKDLYIEAYGPADEPVWKGAEDLSTRVAFAYDEDHFYVAARVSDDVHRCADRISDSWNADSIQFGLDFWQDRSTGFEFSFADSLIAFTTDGPQAWLCQNDRGVDRGVIGDAVLNIQHGDGYAVYEAAIPRARYTSLPLQLTPGAGIRFRANDSDDDKRKGWLGLSDTAVVTDEFGEFVPASFEPPPHVSEFESAVVIDDTVRVMSGSEAVRLVLAAFIPREQSVSVEIALERDGRTAAAGSFDVDMPLGTYRRQLNISAGDIASGAYICRAKVSSDDGPMAERTFPIYIMGE